MCLVSCVTEELCVSGKSCGPVHAASPSTSSVLTGHAHRERLSLSQLSLALSPSETWHVSRGNSMGLDGGWKVPLDFKNMLKSESWLLYMLISASGQQESFK